MAQPYLQVNVYPSKQGWMYAVLLKTPGRPHGRLLSRIAHDQPLPDSHDLAGALRSASQVLGDWSDNV